MAKETTLSEKLRSQLGSLVGYGSIFASEIILGIILLVYPQYLFPFYTCKVVGAIFIGLLSDAYKRKTILCFCLIALSLLSLTIFILHINGIEQKGTFLLVPIIAIALFGDASIPGLSSLVDYHPKIERRKLMAKAIKVETIVWMLIGLLALIFFFKTSNFFIIGAVLSGLLVVPALLSSDETHPVEKELSGIHGFIGEIKKLGRIKTVLIITSALILMSEIGFFLFFFKIEEDIPNTIEKARSILCWGIPMFLGCSSHNSIFSDTKEKPLIVSGLILTVLGILIYLIFNDPTIYRRNIHYISYAVMGYGSGLFLPCFYSVMSSLRGKHYQGFLIGLVDSMRTIGEWTASTLFQLHIIKNPIFFFITSFGIFALNLPLFIKYLNSRKKLP